MAERIRSRGFVALQTQPIRGGSCCHCNVFALPTAAERGALAVEFARDRRPRLKFGSWTRICNRVANKVPDKSWVEHNVLVALTWCVWPAFRILVGLHTHERAGRARLADVGIRIAVFTSKAPPERRGC